MIQIGNIKSVGHAENFNISPDDRQTLVQVVGGVTVEDYGVVDNGEVISLVATFSAADYAALVTVWKNRTLLTVTLDDGTVINNARIVLRNITYANTQMTGYKRVTMEVWRI